MSDPKSFRIERNDEFVAELVLTGPGHGNAVGPDFWREFPDAVEALNADRDVRCLIVRGDGDHFCYGLDLQGMIGEVGAMLTNENVNQPTFSLSLGARGKASACQV